MKNTEEFFRNTEIREKLRYRLSRYFYKLYTYRTADLVARDVRVATGQVIPSSTISKWLYEECSPSPERQILLDITYDNLSEYLHEPFRVAHKKRKERELEAIISNARKQLEEIRAI